MTAVPCPKCGDPINTVGVGWCPKCRVYTDWAPQATAQEVADRTVLDHARGWGPVAVVYPWPILVSVNNRSGGMVGWTSKEYRAALEAMRHAAAAQVKGSPTAAPVRLTVHYHPPDRRRRDCHNLDKAIMDSLIGVAYADDSQVVEWRGHKMPPSSDPRAVIEVEVIAGEVAA